MTDLAIAPTIAATPEGHARSAAALAARIPIPVALPPRYDGEPLAHLSATSYRLFSECPEAFRRRYILGERSPKSTGMVIGSRVDDALADYTRHRLEHGQTPSIEEAIDAYHKTWPERLEQDSERDTLVFDEFDEDTARQVGAEALKAALEQLVPRLGQPVAVQRRLELTLAPGLKWTIIAYLDLETRQPQAAGPPAEVVVDYKMKAGSAVSQHKADRDPQASLYLAARWLEGQPAERFTFAQVLRRSPRRASTSTAQTRTERSIGERRATLARIAQVASQIVAAYEVFGPDRPWAFADADHWRCSPKYCAAWPSCPGGAGL